MKNLSVVAFSLVSSFVMAHAFAASDVENRLGELEKKVSEISAKNSMGNLGPNLASARAEPKGMGWNLSVDVLYWQTKVAPADYCYLNDAAVDFPINSTLTNQFVDYDWNWGFKVAAGYNFEHDQWDTKLEYTYFRNTGNNCVGPVCAPSAVQSKGLDESYYLTQDSISDFLDLSLISVNAGEARAHVKNSYDNLYLDLGREFYVSKCLSIRPSIGVEAAWINLKSCVKFTGGTQSSFNFYETVGGFDCNTLCWNVRSKFTGVGPRAAMNTKWHLCEGFSIYGNANAALLFSYLQHSAKGTYSGKPNNQENLISNFHALSPTAKFELGIMYDAYIMCDTQHVGISLGYENQYYWDIAYIYNQTRSLGLYGVTLKLQWDF
jgi:hypothetical protein